MLDEVDEVAFALWTSDTGNASRADWMHLIRGRDRYLRMAQAALNSLAAKEDVQDE